MQTMDSMKTIANCIWDASAIFPDIERRAVRSKFVNSLTMTKSYISEMSRETHEGMLSLEQVSEDHFWYEDLDSGEVVGTLPRALVTTYKELGAAKDIKQVMRLIGRLGHLCVDAYVNQHLIEHQDGFAIRGRVVHDVEAHLIDMPFLWEGILDGDAFRLVTALTEQKAVEISLGDEGWARMNIKVSNCYLRGNGWPAAKPFLQESYNKACNELAKAVLIARGDK